MDSPDPKDSTALNIYQREFADAEKQQIKLDLWVLDGWKDENGNADKRRRHATIKEQVTASRRLSEQVIKMYQKGVIELFDGEFEILASGIVTPEIRQEIKKILLPSQTEEK
jgi:hypothetical protein